MRTVLGRSGQFEPVPARFGPCVPARFGPVRSSLSGPCVPVGPCAGACSGQCVPARFGPCAPPVRVRPAARLLPEAEIRFRSRQAIFRRRSAASIGRRQVSAVPLGWILKSCRAEQAGTYQRRDSRGWLAADMGAICCFVTGAVAEWWKLCPESESAAELWDGVSTSGSRAHHMGIQVRHRSAAAGPGGCAA
jgi:hypothetical protein